MAKIITDKGEIIQTTGEPRYNEFHKCWYAAGYRWIKTRQAFSKTPLIHNFESYKEEAA